jgi:hypothetical protein
MDPELNYFNYFTEIERFYQSRRESFTLLSTLDWVLIENWKEQGLPLEIVLKGIDRAFSRARRKINSLAYCVKAVEEVSKEQKDLRVDAPPLPEFSSADVERYVHGLADQVTALGNSFPEFQSKFTGIAEAVVAVDSANLREAEQVMAALEEKLIALLKVAADEKTLVEVKQDVDRDLNTFRSAMTVEQLTMLEQQMWRRKLMERFGVSRLSLFYLI